MVEMYGRPARNPSRGPARCPICEGRKRDEYGKTCVACQGKGWVQG